MNHINSKLHTMAGTCGAFLVLTSLAINTASAQTFRSTLYHGTACQAVKGSQNKVEYSQFGISNMTNTVATVECALPTSCETNELCAPSTVAITIYDRNVSQNVSCKLRSLAPDGTVIWEETKNSSGSSIPATGLAFQPPNETTTFSFWNVRCTLPALNPQLGQFAHSYLASIHMLVKVR